MNVNTLDHEGHGNPSYKRINHEGHEGVLSIDACARGRSGVSWKSSMFFMVTGCCLDALGPLAVASDHLQHRLRSEFDRLNWNALVSCMDRLEEVEA